MADLALNGGAPLWSEGWPAWPVQTPRTLENAMRCLQSERWAISGPRLDSDGFEQIFAGEFADFLGVPYCVPTVNGTSSLLVALEALDIGAGDEVIVPGLTWVASASTVMAVNARPVIVDVDRRTLCIDPEAIRAAIGPRTRAVSIVHLYSSVCDLTAIRELCDRHGLALIEDCAQAHGAEWEGRKVGGWGDVGAFSMQQTKLLTAGEGGAATTRDETLYRRMYQLRSDGRSRVALPRPGEMELSMAGEVMGSNYCMSELNAAVLSGQLLDLRDQNTRRAGNAALLDAALAAVPGVTPIQALPQVTERTYYYYTFRIDPGAFGGHTAESVSAALRAETGAPFQPVYPPLPRHPLLRPATKRRYGAIPGLDGILKAAVPQAEAVYRECVTVHHSALLADPARIAVLAEAVAKVQQHAGELDAMATPMDNPL
ncbi:DegT/DnrJ/EryC1/StrS family aminotransferase [Kitasatospora aureofaciens]|uniref:DegT/DnrJ/EryC1/StrS family aminotransferase n=1 Tax=Kitasatospora aureofaciens TaxID=1894 RepID=UPI0037CB960D